jgi:hypothetical protein
MIIILLMATLVAVIVQIISASLTVFGVLPLIVLLVVAWLSQRFSAGSALPLMMIAGFVLSFFALNPALVIASYTFAGLILMVGVMVDSKHQDLSFWASTLTVLLASLVLIFLQATTSIESAGFLPSLTLIMGTTLITAMIWSLMFVVARPR